LTHQCDPCCIQLQQQLLCCFIHLLPLLPSLVLLLPLLSMPLPRVLLLRPLLLLLTLPLLLSAGLLGS
jgi:hypothetical protein